MDEALKRLFATPSRNSRTGLDTELLPLSDVSALLGRVLAENLDSPLNVPSADNSAMDGYALRLADVPGSGAVLPVSQRIAAGHPGQPLQPGTAARIFTGAFVPPGADAVVMQEHTTALDGERVQINTVPKPGQAIRRCGEDIQRGAPVLQAGQRLSAQSLGLAASVGVAQLRVFRKLRVAVFFTGDELVTPGDAAPEALPPGKIFNSNRPVLTSLLHGLGCEVLDLGNVPDSLEATKAALRQAVTGGARADLIITCGGVSVGEEDHVKPAVRALGSLDLWQVAIKPGKPLAFGRVGDGEASGAGQEALFVGLPGNPVSSFVTFVMLVRPLIRHLQGLGGAEQPPPALRLPAATAWPTPGAKVDQRREFLRARINADGHVELFANQGSGVLTSTAWAHGLVDNPPGQAFAVGQTVSFIPFSELMQ